MLSDSQLNELKSETKDAIGITWKLSASMIGNSNNEATHKFSHTLLLTERQVINLPKVFANNLSANMKLSKI